MMLSSTEFHLGLSLILFCLGALGFVARGSGIIALMCLELMLNGVNLALVTFGRFHQSAEASSLVLFVVLVAAAEAAVALSIFVSLFKKMGNVSLENLRSLKG